MLNKNTKIKATNRSNSSIGYTLPDMNNLRRKFYPGETKEVSYEESKLFEKYLKEGNYRLMRALDEADTVYFDLPSDMADMVKNSNTPEDYEKIKA